MCTSTMIVNIKPTYYAIRAYGWWVNVFYSWWVNVFYTRPQTLIAASYVQHVHLRTLGVINCSVDQADGGEMCV
jgi:hypothetical protein